MRVVADDNRCAQKPFQVSDPAFVAVALVFCLLVFGILAQIAIFPGPLHFCVQFRPQYILPMMQLLLYLADVHFGHFVFHSHSPFWGKDEYSINCNEKQERKS